MKFFRELARILLLILLVVSMISCTSTTTCNDEGNTSAFRRAFSSRRAAAVGCPAPGGGGGGGGGGSCNSQLSPTSVLFGLTSTGQFEQWEIATTGDLFLTCNTASAAVGQTVTAAGKYVYVFDTTKPQIFGFSMSTGGKGALTAIPGQPFTSFNLPDFFGPFDFIVADPLGRFLLVPSLETNSVHVLLISATGVLSEAANSPFAVPNPEMLTIDPSGSFVYIADTDDGDIFFATIDPGGQLVVSAIPIIPQSPPFWLAVNPNGNFLYSADALDVETFSITPITGGLVEIGVPIDISSFTATGAPEMTAIDSTGSYFYLVFENSVGILGFSISPGTGVLNQIQQTVFTGSNAAAIDQMLTDPFQANMYVVSGGGIFNVPINTTNGNLTVPPLTVVAGSTPTTSGPLSISRVPQ
jgi:6-phosphogluconolactonase (cycloisomerase 2 family)